MWSCFFSVSALKKKENNTNYSSSSFKNVGGIRAKEVRVKQLRALVALPEDLGSIPSIKWQLMTVQRGLTPSFGFLGYQAHTWYTDTHAGRLPGRRK